MKYNLFFLFPILTISSCSNNIKIPLYNIENKREDNNDFFLPLLDKDSFDKLIQKKASFPLFIYSSRCEDTCSTFPYLLNYYLKENNVFFPMIYESVFTSYTSGSEIQPSIYIYSKGEIKVKTNISYFKNNSLSDYMNKYTYINNITILNDLTYKNSESNFSLASFSSFEETSSNLNINLVKENDVLIINDNKIDSFDDNYEAIIKDFKYIYFSSYLNESFYSTFNVKENNSIYSKLYYSNGSFYLDSY